MLRAADAAIDIEAMRVTWQNAAWRFDTGRDAADAARVAKWQASERGQRTVHATQHLHGGMGADITYPIHRYFLWGKQIELLLGGPSAQLARLGADDRRAGARPGGGGAVSARGRTLRADLLRRLGGRRAADARAPDHAHADRVGRHRQPRLPGRAPRPGAGQGAGLEGHLHEHPHHQRPGRPLRDRLVGPAQPAVGGQHPARRAELSRLHHDAHGIGHREGPAGRRRDERHGDRRRSAAPTTWATTSPARSASSSLLGRRAVRRRCAT